jgi:hypothetical protein
MRSDFRRLSPTRSRASGKPGAISTSGTSPKSSIFALEKDGLGFQVFNATNDEVVANEPTMSFLTKHAPQTPKRRELEGFEAPMSNRKARELFWASASCTTGEDTLPLLIDRQPRIICSWTEAPGIIT